MNLCTVNAIKTEKPFSRSVFRMSQQLQRAVTRARVQSTVFDWRVENVPSFNQKPGDSIDSPLFTCAQLNWQLRFCPGGENDETTDFWSVWLALMSPGKVLANFQIQLRDANKDDEALAFEDFNNIHFSKPRVDRVMPLTGSTRFVLRASVKATDVVLRCTLGIVNVVADTLPSTTTTSSPTCNWAQNLLDTGLLSDVTITINKERDIAAHRCVLAARSPVFRAMFQQSMQETAVGQVHIDDVDAVAFDSFLRSLYSLSLDSKCQCVPGVLVLADRYQVADLVRACLDHLTSTVTEKNLVDLLQLAALLSENESTAAHLTAACVAFVRQSSGSVLHSLLMNEEAKLLLKPDQLWKFIAAVVAPASM